MQAIGAGNAWWSSGLCEDVFGCCPFLQTMKHCKRMTMHSWLSPTPSFVFCVCVVQAVCACCWVEGAHTHVWRSTGKRLRSRVFLFNSPPLFLKQSNSVSLSQLSLLSSLWALEPTCFCLLAREAQQWDTYLCSCCGFKLRSSSCSTEQTGIYSQCVKEEHW